MNDTKVKGSNLTEEDRKKGGEHSHNESSSNESSSGIKGGQSSNEGQEWQNDPGNNAQVDKEEDQI